MNWAMNNDDIQRSKHVDNIWQEWIKLTSGTTILSVSEFSMSGAFEQLWFPVLAMNCGCSQVEPVAAIFSFLYLSTDETNTKAFIVKPTHSTLHLKYNQNSYKPLSPAQLQLLGPHYVFSSSMYKRLAVLGLVFVEEHLTSPNCILLFDTFYDIKSPKSKDTFFFSLSYIFFQWDLSLSHPFLSIKLERVLLMTLLSKLKLNSKYKNWVFLKTQKEQ